MNKSNRNHKIIETYTYVVGHVFTYHFIGFRCMVVCLMLVWDSFGLIEGNCDFLVYDEGDLIQEASF